MIFSSMKRSQARCAGTCCNPSTREMRAGRLWVGGQPGPHNETLPKKQTNKQKTTRKQSPFWPPILSKLNFRIPLDRQSYNSKGQSSEVGGLQWTKPRYCKGFYFLERSEFSLVPGYYWTSVEATGDAERTQDRQKVVGQVCWALDGDAH
jgi:hypothetical protein